MLFTESSCGVSSGSRLSRIGVTGLALMVIAINAPGAWGQCGGTISVTDDPNSVIGDPFTHLVVGQELELVVQFGPVDDSAIVNSFTVSLDCQNLELGACGAACTNDGLALLYLGDATISGYTCGPFGAAGIESDQPGGIAADNTVTFTFVDAMGNPDPILLPAGMTCGFRFGVVVGSLSGDASVNRITGKGETAGDCTGGDPFGLCGAYSIFLADPAIDIDKTVTPLGECENSGNSVTYHYSVTNEGDVPLSNIVVVDDNGTAPTPPVIPPPAISDDFNPDPVLQGDGIHNVGDVNDNDLLDLTETWLYTSSRTVASLPLGDTTNTAVVNGDYVNVIGTTTVDADDPATVTIGPGPDCEITADPPCPDSTDNTACVPDAGPGATYEWSLNGGTITDGQGTNCITYTAGSSGDVVIAVIVTTDDDCFCKGGLVLEIGSDDDCTITGEPPCPDSTGNTACVPDAGLGATYDWNINGGTITDGENERCVTYTAPATGTVLLEVTVSTPDGCTCTDELELTLAVCGGEGCTPGYWKNHAYLWDAGCPNADPATDVTTNYQTCDLFNATFGVTAAQSGLADTVTLHEALSVSGRATGGCNKFALARHAAAALLNADAGIDYAFTTAEIIELYQDAVGAIAGDETVCTAHTQLSDANELGCPCNNVGCGNDTEAAANVSADAAPAPPPDSGANNAFCGFGVATMMPFAFVGWTLARRRKSGV